ncbi:hypothetical protein BVY01_01375 [bacterium I07]|nr:hypothetical protein BVY01_01375 [bacterium I07]
MPTINHTKVPDRFQGGTVRIDSQTKDPSEYRTRLLMEYLKSTGVQMEDVVLFQRILKTCERNSESFLEWYLKAEDAIKTLRKNLELEEMEAMERIP